MMNKERDMSKLTKTTKLVQIRNEGGNKNINSSRHQGKVTKVLGIKKSLTNKPPNYDFEEAYKIRFSKVEHF